MHVRTLRGATDAMTCLCTTGGDADDAVIVGGSFDGTVHWWGGITGRKLPRLLLLVMVPVVLLLLVVLVLVVLLVLMTHYPCTQFTIKHILDVALWQ